MKGKIKFFTQERNFGFITGQDGKDYFFHMSDIINCFNPKKNAEVQFQTTKTDRGTKATNVQEVEQ